MVRGHAFEGMPAGSGGPGTTFVFVSSPGSTNVLANMVMLLYAAEELYETNRKTTWSASQYATIQEAVTDTSSRDATLSKVSANPPDRTLRQEEWGWERAGGEQKSPRWRGLSRFQRKQEAACNSIISHFV